MDTISARGRCEQDMLHLADHFLRQTCATYRLAAKKLARDARLALMTQGWPGTVLELQHVIERVVLLDDADIVTAAMLGLDDAHFVLN
jgi:DNA-binding NtrC family response regulator